MTPVISTLVSVLIILRFTQGPSDFKGTIFFFVIIRRTTFCLFYTSIVSLSRNTRVPAIHFNFKNLNLYQHNSKCKYCNAIVTKIKNYLQVICGARCLAIILANSQTRSNNLVV